MGPENEFDVTDQQFDQYMAESEPVVSIEVPVAPAAISPDELMARLAGAVAGPLWVLSATNAHSTANVATTPSRPDLDWLSSEYTPAS